MIRRRRLTRPRSRGQALVEAAMVLPILLLLVMGVIDVGRIIFAHLALQEATQEGAIYAAYKPNPRSDIQMRVRTSSGAISDPNAAEWVANATVQVCHLDLTPADRIRVTSTYPLDLVTPIVPDILGTSTVTLRAEITATNFTTTDLTAGCTP
jgi:Flp pilus assembly protein TadG